MGYVAAFVLAGLLAIAAELIEHYRKNANGKFWARALRASATAVAVFAGILQWQDGRSDTEQTQRSLTNLTLQLRDASRSSEDLKTSLGELQGETEKTRRSIQDNATLLGEFRSSLLGAQAEQSRLASDIAARTRTLNLGRIMLSGMNVEWIGNSEQQFSQFVWESVTAAVTRFVPDSAAKTEWLQRCTGDDAYCCVTQLADESGLTVSAYYVTRTQSYPKDEPLACRTSETILSSKTPEHRLGPIFALDAERDGIALTTDAPHFVTLTRRALQGTQRELRAYMEFRTTRLSYDQLEIPMTFAAIPGQWHIASADPGVSFAADFNVTQLLHNEPFELKPRFSVKAGAR